MRTDIKFDRKQVICRHSILLGYFTNTARFGDLVEWEENNSEHIGRVIGRISYDPLYKSTNWLVVASLNLHLSCVAERWVNPEWVTSVTPSSQIPKLKELLETFLSDEFRHATPDKLRRWTWSGYRSLRQIESEES